MHFFRVLILGALAAALPVRAVYAPIPEKEQGKNLLVTLRAGVAYDSNIFSAATGAIDSAVFSVAPKVSYNASLTDQTFFSGSYGLKLDQFTDRPGDKLLDSHDLTLRIAHAFSKATTIDVFDMFMRSGNPESPLVGLPPNPDGTPQKNPDQSFNRNQIDARFDTPLGAKVGLTVKARSIYYDYYRNETLGRSIDRIENLYGAAGDYAVLPEVKLVLEGRHQDVFYRKEGREAKNKRSDFAMGGFDYFVAKKMSLSGRLGAEWRHRVRERSVTTPYAEFSGKYDYAEDSYISGGYGYTLEEATDTTRYTDMKVHRLFVNVQHHFTALIVGSASLTYEPSQLQARRALVPPVANVDDTTVRTGVALSYLPTKNWTLSASYDYDRVRSDERTRELLRHRFGVSAAYAY